MPSPIRSGRFWLWHAPLLLWLAFCFWYTNTAGPLTPDEIEDLATRLAERTLAARIFADSHRPMNRSVLDVGGGVLAVSQFTLAADTGRGNRPSFGHAAPPEVARPLYEAYVAALRAGCDRVETGAFGTEMRVALVNDGPVTVLLEAN